MKGRTRQSGAWNERQPGEAEVSAFYDEAQTVKVEKLQQAAGLW